MSIGTILLIAQSGTRLAGTVTLHFTRVGRRILDMA